ncbi:MAG: Do family serine endopeptidase [Bacteroides sp.]|nr:Do family serine endopeptidase [Bacteroides sp.]
MKKLIKLMVPSIIGSALTIAVFLLTDIHSGDSVGDFQLKEQVPVHQALYTVKEDGEFVALDFTGISKEAMNSVVHVRSARKMQSASNSFGDMFGEDFFRFFQGTPSPRGQQQSQPEPYVQMGSGSGVIISSDGYIVTNNHVIENADEIEVTLHNNETYKAKVVGCDPSTDVAVLQIKEEGLQSVSMGNSDLVEVGEWVMAIGNPFNLNSTVTAGIISAKGRNINIIDDKSAIEAFIQTDAAINPGNSGGALVNLRGELIGINTAIASPTGSYTGYGFAIPSNIVNKVVMDIVEYGMVQRAYLGIMVRNIDSDFVEEEKLKISEGTYVDSLMANSAAKEAGIHSGDVITGINKVAVLKSSDLLEQIGMQRPGDEVELTVDRFGKEMTFQVKLANQKGEMKLASKEELDILDILGAELEELDKHTAEKLGIEGGVIVRDLKNGILKNQTSISEGFIITGINNQKVASVNDLRKSLEKEKGGVLLQGIYENYPGELYYAFGIPE